MKINNSNSIIIKAINDGDDTIIKEFYKVHLPRVTSYVLKNSGDLDHARDVFQDAMVIVFEKIKSDGLRINCALGTYVYSICKYLWLNKLRKTRKTEVNETGFEKLQDPMDDVVDVIDKSEKRLLIHKYLLKLGSGCQEILLMFFEGYSLREIAKQKDFTEGYTRKRKFLCQRKLIELVEKDPIFKEFKSFSNNK